MGNQVNRYRLFTSYLCPHHTDNNIQLELAILHEMCYPSVVSIFLFYIAGLDKLAKLAHSHKSYITYDISPSR